MVKLALVAVSAFALTGAAAPPVEPAVSRFRCQDGPDLTAQFATRGARFGAIVDAGDGPHFLPARPWIEGPVKLTWSDGRRTLTWSPGVLITWADGGAAKVCGRSGGHDHRPVRGEGPERAA